MRTDYKLFGLMVLFTFLVSLSRNVNKIYQYRWFPENISEMLFGLTYTIPCVVCGYIIYKRAKFFWERVISLFFLMIALSALMDEILFDPFTPQIWEHITALILTAIIYIYERAKETRY